MPNKSEVFLSFEVEQTLINIGSLLRRTRLANGDTEGQVAERLNVSRGTWHRIERGDPNVRIGTFLQALVNYQLKGRVVALADEDELTTLLTRQRLPKRAGQPRKKGPS